MKTVAILAFVLCAGIASATELRVPQLAPKREPVQVEQLPPVAVQLTAYAACMQRVTTQCGGTHRTKFFTRACVSRNRYQCRSKS
jgi:hypothetical protein